MQENTKKSHKSVTIRFVIALIGALLFIAPFWFVIMNSVKPLSEIMISLLSLPKQILFSNYSLAWTQIGLGKVLLNTAIVTGVSLVLILLLSSMVAWWSIRHSTTFSKMFLSMLLVSLMVPFATLMLSIVKVMSALHLTDSLLGGIASYSGMGIAFGTFMMTGAVKGVPVELEEAAEIDGCNVYQTFFRVVMPLLKPTLLSLFVLDLFWIWNDYIVALALLNKPELTTLQLAINKLFGLYSNRWDLALPAIVISVLPIILINIFMQKKIVDGVSAGAVKG